MRFLLIILLFISKSYAQTYPYGWQGVFELSNTDTLNPILPWRVSFNIDWNETNGTIRGTYRDSISGPVPLTGAVTASGRIFYVNFPQVFQGIKSLEMSSSETGGPNGQVPVSVTVRDGNGTQIAVRNILATMTSAATSGYCSMGFGSLAGYCGRYTGTSQETSDMSNICALNTSTKMVVEMLPSTEVAIYTNGVRQPLGTLVNSPLSSHLKQIGRVCSQPPGTQFNASHCLTLSLEGDFQTQADQRAFIGTYSIRDDISGEICSYSLNLDTLSP